jgi:glycopeptide antibiotics resistance protein
MTNAQLVGIGWGLAGFAVLWPVLLLAEPRRPVTAGAALLYSCALVGLVLLPLGGPGPEQVFQPVPFQWVADIGTELAEHGRPAGRALGTLTFQQVVLNVLLFAPLGFFGRWLWNLRPRRTVALGFAASLGIETAQLTAGHRIFDVDDLMTNTAGAALGWLAAAAVLVVTSHARRVPDRLGLQVRPQAAGVRLGGEVLARAGAQDALDGARRGPLQVGADRVGGAGEVERVDVRV